MSHAVFSKDGTILCQKWNLLCFILRVEAQFNFPAKTGSVSLPRLPDGSLITCKLTPGFVKIFANECKNRRPVLCRHRRSHCQTLCELSYSITVSPPKQISKSRSCNDKSDVSHEFYACHILNEICSSCSFVEDFLFIILLRRSSHF